MKRPLVALIAVVGVALVLLAALEVAQRSTGRVVETPPPPVLTATTVAPTDNPLQTDVPSPMPTPTRTIREWTWARPGFSGSDAVTLTHGIEQYVYYNWSAACDAPAWHQIPMIWGRGTFYTDHVTLQNLFDGLCNDGRPLLFLNEPAKAEQANISPLEAAHMFYTMTRGTDWPYERWHGPIYAGNNVVEERHWDAEFVAEFGKLNGGKTAIPEIAGWGIHVYGNYEYGDMIGDPSAVWTGDVPPGEIRNAVYRSMRQVDAYLAERRAEGNATALAVTEFGLLQASAWHTPPTRLYRTTASFMSEYVRQFDRLPEIQAWMWFMSKGAQDEFLDTNLAVDGSGALTPNGVMWRELAQARQTAP